jgi:hypothetical protein
VRATAVILDFVMVVSIRLNWGGVKAAIPIGRGRRKKVQRPRGAWLRGPPEQ